MRLVLAVAAAQSLGFFLHKSEAFTPATSLVNRAAAIATKTSTLNVGFNPDGLEQDDEFLESLSGKNPSAELPEKDIDGADLTPEMREKLRANNERDELQGGTKFKQLLEAAKKAGTSRPTEQPMSIKNPFAENPYAGIEGLDPTMGPSAAPGNVNINEMTVEEQAEMFRKMMAGQITPPAAQQPVASLLPPDPPAKPDRKTGRNRDADAIQNTADVYFAQLKRDSTVRTVARHRGDIEKAEAVFADPKIKELETLISINPHLAGKREEEKKIIETAAEEMIAYQEALDAKRGKSSTAGPSYKNKLEQMKKQRSGGGTPAVASTFAPPASTPPAPPKEPEAVAKPTPVAAPELPVKPTESRQKNPGAFAVDDIPHEQAPSQPEVAATAASRPKAQPTIAIEKITSESSDEEIKKGIRTLMGMILKHRGGPGFGAGGLKGSEIAQFEELKGYVVDLLKEEAMSNVGTAAPTSVAQAAPVPEMTTTTPAAAGSSSDQAQVKSILAALDGAIMMYRNSPSELKPAVLSTLRAALLAAVNTCNDVMDQGSSIPVSASSAAPQVDGMLACVEGAILMYRNSPPELQAGVLPPLQAALLSAVMTCNKIIADGEADNVQKYQEATAGIEKPASARKPTQFFEVQTVKPPAVSAPAGVDENTKKLESVYSSLQAAAGDGKMGLRKDLSSAEASDLADGIAEMRAIMMEELNSGIPEAASPAAAAPASSSDSKTMSRYQQMLAIAKEEKAREAAQES